MLEAVFFNVTAPAVLTAIISGLAFGLLLNEAVSFGRERIVSFLAFATGLFWYVPQAVHRFLFPTEDAAPNAAERTVGAMLVYFIFMTAALGCMILVRWFDHRRLR